MVLSVMSLAVRVALPTVFKVILKVLLPETRAALAGIVALLSDDVIATVSVPVLTTFQLASTALAVTLNAVPAVRAVGVPVLPLPVPGAAVSPGNKSCNFTKAAALTVIELLVLAVLLGSGMSLAVTVRPPVVFKVTLKFRVPATSAAFPGRTALVSDEVMPMVSVTLVITFQFASTALTVTLKAAAAV